MSHLAAAALLKAFIDEIHTQVLTKASVVIYKKLQPHPPTPIPDPKLLEITCVNGNQFITCAINNNTKGGEEEKRDTWKKNKTKTRVPEN